MKNSTKASKIREQMIEQLKKHFEMADTASWPLQYLDAVALLLADGYYLQRACAFVDKRLDGKDSSGQTLSKELAETCLLILNSGNCGFPSYVDHTDYYHLLLKIRVHDLLEHILYNTLCL